MKKIVSICLVVFNVIFVAECLNHNTNYESHVIFVQTIDFYYVKARLQFASSNSNA